MTKLFCRPMSLVCGGIALLLSGCVDDSFDLDNYDDSMQVAVKNLTIPLQFEDGIKFGDLIDISDNELVEVDSKGNYVLLQSGDFESEAIEINELEATPNIKDFESEPSEFPCVAGFPVDFNVEQYAKFDFEFEYDQVDAYIRNITGGDVDFNITFKVETKIPCEFEDLTFRMPTGMTGYVNGDHGAVETDGELVRFKKLNCPDGTFEFDYHVTRLNIAEAGGVLTPGGNGDYGVFHLKNSLALVSGKIIAKQSGTGILKASFSLGSIRVKTIDGSIKYSIDDFSQSSTLEDLPDLLKDSNTHLSLVNPQLYLRVNNPFGKYHAQASTQITLKQQRTNPDDYLEESARTVTTDGPVDITDQELQLFVLSAENPGADAYKPFVGAKWTAMNDLGNIVYGKGMPNSLEFIFTNTMLDSDRIENFPIGKKVGTVHGEYAFYAPLAFGENSQVVYSQDQTGWDISDLVVTGLEITANVTSTVPVGVMLNAYPIIKGDDGEPVVDKNIEITSTKIGGLAENAPVTIKMDFKGQKELRGLDGMRYTATLLSADKGAIGPDQELNLKNLKVTISGYYDINGNDDDE